MAAPTTLLITFISSPPTVTGGITATSIVTKNIPPASTYSDFVRMIEHGGGCWYSDAAGLLNWIPLSQIVKITAQ